METKKERADRMAKLLAKARLAGNLSQQQLADKLGVSRKTIQNWEDGSSFPNIFNMFELFDVCGVNPTHYMYQYIHPNEIEDIKAEDDDERIVSALEQLLFDMSIQEKRALFYIIYGSYGSDPKAVLQLELLYCHLPLRHRVSVARNICEIYEMCEERDELVETDHIMPDFNLVKDAILNARKSAKDGREGYNI